MFIANLQSTVEPSEGYFIKNMLKLEHRQAETTLFQGCFESLLIGALQVTHMFFLRPVKFSKISV